MNEELSVNQALQKGVDAHKAGKVQEADRYYTAILQTQPTHPDANHNMGVLAVGVGKVETALPFFKTALEANPSTAQFWLSYIDALIKLERVSDAKAVFDQAKSNGAKGDGFDQIEKSLIEIEKGAEVNTSSGKSQEPPEAQVQSLISLYSRGQHQEALTQAVQLLKQFPTSVNLYNIIGAANKSMGKLEEAIEAYKNALLVKPDFAEAYYNMGNSLYDQGKREEAIMAWNKALSTQPDYADAYNNLGNALKGKTFNKPNRDLQKTIIALLDRKIYVRPLDIAKAAISLLKFEPSLQKHLQPVEGEFTQHPLDIISDLNELPLLLQLMGLCPLPDLELQVLLTNLRCSILSNISSLKEASPEIIGFQSALALQCFTNEYVYSDTEEEKKTLRDLEKNVKDAFKNNQHPSPQIMLALASYKALNQYNWCNLLLVNDDIQQVFSRQVEEPNHEEKLKQDLPVLNKITDSVSSKVRAQYEESPYPRWVNLGLKSRPMSISEIVDQFKLKLHGDKITEVERPNILIAGCGTGQHSIGTASTFKSSKVLAIDLSLSSLAYAKRKSDELAIKNVEYMQADILDLGQLNKQFDIIESVGVLHHMDNPMAGWRVLTDCLKPGGLMRIGLYSELARQKSSAKIRDEISELGIGSSDEEMKSFRDTIIRSEKDHHKLIIKSPDFYSLSTLRDLLFHVQEHRFIIPQIKDHLDKLNLKFCGFSTNAIVSHFNQTNTNKDDLYDLDKWQAYEQSNPRAFSGMYQFWCQKVD